MVGVRLNERVFLPKLFKGHQGDSCLGHTSLTRDRSRSEPRLLLTHGPLQVAWISIPRGALLWGALFLL